MKSVPRSGPTASEIRPFSVVSLVDATSHVLGGDMNSACGLELERGTAMENEWSVCYQNREQIGGDNVHFAFATVLEGPFVLTEFCEMCQSKINCSVRSELCSGMLCLECVSCVQRYSSAVTGLEWPTGFQEVKVQQCVTGLEWPRGFQQVKVQQSVTGLEWPRGFQQVKVQQCVTGLEWPRGFQQVKVQQCRYRPGVAHRVPGS